MKRAIPLAAGFFLFLASSASAAPCPVPVVDLESPDPVPLADSAPECVVASSLVRDFAKLRAAASFNESNLLFRIEADTSSSNGYYYKGAVYMTRAYLLEEKPREARLATMAHEIGHGVQDKDGTLAWAHEPSDKKEQLARNRRLEAQADAIGQELLVRAGYDPNTFTRGREKAWGCQNFAGLYEEVTTHPADAQRMYNAALNRGAVAGQKATDMARSLTASLGGAPMPAAPAAGAPAASATKKAFTPSTSIHDFDELGRVKPGRLVSERVRVPLPASDAGPVRGGAQTVLVSVVDYWIADPFKAAIDRLSGGPKIASQVLAACGTPKRAELEEDFGPLGWAKRVAADAARRAVTRSPNYKTIPGGVNG